MKNLIRNIIAPTSAILLLASGSAFAQYGEGGGTSATTSSSGTSGSTAFTSYLDVMYSLQNSDDDVRGTTTTQGGGGGGLGGVLGGGGNNTEPVRDPVLDQGQGITVLAGFRRKGWYGFEFGGSYAKDEDVQKQSLLFNTLIYPFENNFYIKLASGVTRYVEYPLAQSVDAFEDSDDDFITINYGAGIGYVFPFELSDTPLGIRAEVVYHVADRFLERENDFEEDINAPGNLKEIQFNLGIRIPLR
ncbi:hypothetical protein AB4876_09895 [Zhongshania guokunii]|uniref:Outer membrane protein beta-barrel domain-containing protein n=1 Tax=Zhongshania guokunii TaxID=641783 RepID=A0ABV3U7U8_9GAMM